jgi:pimeloyl-ACP methyl ester carboxylesterase
VGPILAGQYRVVALDLSGHGDSEKRSAYSMDMWAREILSVAQVSGMAGPPLIIGHSMGGWVTVVVGATYPAEVAGIVVIDSAIREAQPEELAASQRTAFGPLKVYRSESEALARFRTVPDQPTSLPYILDRIGRASTHQTDQGWMWKFDPNVFGRPRPGPEILGRLTCRVALFRGQYGLVTADIGAQMYEGLGRRAPVIEIPLAGHHIMLDQPLSLVTGLRTLLADWDHSVPRVRGEPRPRQ